MDLGTVVGLTAGTLMLLGSIWLSGGVGGIFAFFDPPSIVVTFGGALCSTLIAISASQLKAIPKIFKKVLFYESRSALELINELVRYAEIARRDGILALEGPAKEIKDPFMVKGIQLAVDGTDPELIRETLQTELDYMGARHSSGKKLFDLLGKYAPAFGMIGTLLGLVLMLKNLNDPSTIGPSMAVAIITSFYGAVAANFIFLPIADKLDMRSSDEMMLKEIVMRGVMSIQSGDNPRLVSQKLKVFLPPDERGSDDK